MKVLRYFNIKGGRFVQHSFFYPEDDCVPPEELCSISMNINPFNLKGATDSLIAKFSNRLSFPERLLELRQFLQVLESMFNVKP